jgi:hypothetical protein
MVRLDLAAPEEDMLERLRVETLWAPFEAPAEIRVEASGSQIMADEWGAGWRRGEAQGPFRAAYAPLAKATSMSDLRGHRWPRPDGSHEERWGRAAERAAAGGDLALCVALKGVLETAGDLRGRARLKAELAGGSPFALSLAARVAEAQILLYGRLAVVPGGDLAAACVTVEGLGEERWDLLAAPGRVFQDQALVLRSLAAAGLSRIIVRGRGSAIASAAADLGAVGVMGFEPPGPNLAWWAGPPAEILEETDPEAAYRAARDWRGSLTRRPAVISPWLAATSASSPLGSAMAALALSKGD